MTGEDVEIVVIARFVVGRHREEGVEGRVVTRRDAERRNVARRNPESLREHAKPSH